MTNPFESPDRPYRVVVNAEEQHSLWPADLDVPAGWTVRFDGSREDCLAYIETNWTDMRPAGLAALDN